MNTIDLFSGCGGLSLGFQNSGFEILAAFDNWQPAVSTYERNFDHPIFNENLTSKDAINKISHYNPQMIIGGPPCQDFSSAGKRDETLGRADLTISFAKIIASIKPQWFVMENVERILKSNILLESIEILKNAGYGITYDVLDASYCGVPQSRKRFFLVGHLGSKDGFLSIYLLKNQTENRMTLFDYFQNRLGLEYYYRHPRSYERRAIFSIHEPSPTIRGVNRPIPTNYVQHPGDPVAVNELIRPLTTRERAMIQTFPEDFVFLGNKTIQEQLIGNAVPVKLGEYVANCINEYISDLNIHANRIPRGQMRLTGL